MNVAMNKKQLIPNCQGLCLGVEKFSGVINSNVAAANSPTTAGRSPMNTLFTSRVCMYFMNILLMRIIRMSEGNTSANVAVADPSIAMGML